LIALAYFSYLDIRYKEVNNAPIALLFLIGVIIAILDKKFIAMACGVVFTLLIGYLLWRFDCMGGADSKIIMALTPFLPFNNIITLMLSIWLFLIEFMIVVFIYALLLKLSGKTKENKQIPLVPIILITYISIYLFI
jgi:Flp pilus assembly protein protease CpaA